MRIEGTGTDRDIEHFLEEDFERAISDTDCLTRAA